MGNKNKKAKKDSKTWLYRLTMPIAGPLVYTIYGLRIIKGKKNLPKEGAAIAAGNHIHFSDPVFLYFAQKRQIRYMAKAELFKNKFLGWVCGNYGAFPVERGSADTESLSTAEQMLVDGKILGIFPEGTRSKDGKVGRGKAGVLLIAHQSGVPIYPFAVFSKKSALRIGSKYTIAFGDPVTAEELGVVTGSPREYREATRKLMNIITELQNDCREYRGLPRITAEDDKKTAEKAEKKEAETGEAVGV